MFGFYSSKPGKGVDKRNPDKSRISVFFEIFLRKFWSLCKLNLLYFVCAIPAFILLMFVVGILSSRITDFFTPLLSDMIAEYTPRVTSADIGTTVIFFDLVLRSFLSVLFVVFLGVGPISAGFTYVLRNFSREEHTWISSDFFQHSKGNFLQALIVLVIDIVVFCLVVLSFGVYSSIGGAVSYLKYVVVFFALSYVMIHLYIYPLMVTFRLSVPEIFKNSVILAFANAPKNLLLILITAVIHIVIPYFLIVNAVTIFALPLYFIFEFVCLISITGFLSSYFTYPSIEQLIDAANEQNNTEE